MTTLLQVGSSKLKVNEDGAINTSYMNYGLKLSDSGASVVLPAAAVNTTLHTLAKRVENGFFGQPKSSGSITAIAASAISGDIKATTSAAHNLSIGDVVTMAGTSDSNYDTRHVVKRVPSTTEFEVTATFGSTATGTFSRGETFDFDGVPGVYEGAFSIGFQSAVAAPYEFAVTKNNIVIGESSVKHTLTATGSTQNIHHVFPVTLQKGDKIRLEVKQLSGTLTNPTIDHVSFSLKKL